MSGDPTQLEQNTRKCNNTCCNKLDEFTQYPKIVITDAIIAVVHIIVMLVLRLAWLMLIPFLLIRLPRFILHCCSRRTQSKINYTREFQFRKWSCICYFPLAVTIQMISMAASFCAVEAYLTTSQCMTGYSIALIIALVIH